MPCYGEALATVQGGFTVVIKSYNATLRQPDHFRSAASFGLRTVYECASHQKQYMASKVRGLAASNSAQSARRPGQG
jgi:hypothetical protein